MSQSLKTLKAHPKENSIDYKQLHKTIQYLNDCHTGCISCADACISLDRIRELRHCIRLCEDTADILKATASILSRQTDPDWETIRSQIHACTTAARNCGNECEEHSEKYQFCLSCAEICAMSVQELTSLAELLPKETA